MNEAPVISRGEITISDSWFSVNDLKKIARPINARINKTPPIISRFQAMTRKAVTTNEGIL